MTRLLIIKPSSLGDVIHALPPLAMLRRALGSQLERVSWVVNDSFAGLLELCPDVDRIVRFPRKTIWQRASRQAFVRELQAEEYDVALDFQGLLRSGLIARASHAPRKVGFADGREFSPWFYTEKIRVPRGHAVLKNLELARRCFGLSDDAMPPDGPLLRVPQATAEASRRLFADGALADRRPLIAIGHSSRWNSKSWPAAFFASVMDEVARRRPEAGFWLLGTAGEADRAEAVAKHCRIARPLNLTGKTSMAELMGALSLSDAMLTNDSGPMHMAAALAVPVVALFGATNPDLTGPYGPAGFHTVIRSCCDKTPCFKHDCPLQKEPSNSEPLCAGGIAPEDVATRLLEAAERKKTIGD